MFVILYEGRRSCAMDRDQDAGIHIHDDLSVFPKRGAGEFLPIIGRRHTRTNDAFKLKAELNRIEDSVQAQAKRIEKQPYHAQTYDVYSAPSTDIGIQAVLDVSPAIAIARDWATVEHVLKETVMRMQMKPKADDNAALGQANALAYRRAAQKTLNVIRAL